MHDFNIQLEEATPGEIESNGAGLVIVAGVCSSPFGNCVIGETSRGICHLSFFDDGNEEAAFTEMRINWPQATVIFCDAQTARTAEEIFTTCADFARPQKLFVRGTAFQLRVWRALLRVPAGALISYGKLAAAAGNPNASRATGTAIGRNSIAFLIPCHRVIRETGSIGNYRWGAIRKRAILAWERNRMLRDL